MPKSAHAAEHVGGGFAHLGQAFHEAEHPRDRLGRFIEVGAHVKLWGGAEGVVKGRQSNGRIVVERDLDHARVSVLPGYLTVTKGPDGKAPNDHTAPHAALPEVPSAPHDITGEHNKPGDIRGAMDHVDAVRGGANGAKPNLNEADDAKVSAISGDLYDAMIAAQSDDHESQRRAAELLDSAHKAASQLSLSDPAAEQQIRDVMARLGTPEGPTGDAAMGVRILTQWLTEQWDHGHGVDDSPLREPQTQGVVVPGRGWVPNPDFVPVTEPRMDSMPDPDAADALAKAKDYWHGDGSMGIATAAAGLVDAPGWSKADTFPQDSVDARLLMADATPRDFTLYHGVGTDVSAQYVPGQTVVVPLQAASRDRSVADGFADPGRGVDKPISSDHTIIEYQPGAHATEIHSNEHVVTGRYRVVSSEPGHVVLAYVGPADEPAPSTDATPSLADLANQAVAINDARLNGTIDRAEHARQISALNDQVTAAGYTWDNLDQAFTAGQGDAPAAPSAPAAPAADHWRTLGSGHRQSTVSKLQPGDSIATQGDGTPAKPVELIAPGRNSGALGPRAVPRTVHHVATHEGGHVVHFTDGTSTGAEGGDASGTLHKPSTSVYAMTAADAAASYNGLDAAGKAQAVQDGADKASGMSDRQVQAEADRLTAAADALPSGPASGLTPAQALKRDTLHSNLVGVMSVAMGRGLVNPDGQWVTHSKTSDPMTWTAEQAATQAAADVKAGMQRVTAMATPGAYNRARVAAAENLPIEERVAALRPFAETGPLYDRAIAEHLFTYDRVSKFGGRGSAARQWISEAERVSDLRRIRLSQAAAAAYGPSLPSDDARLAARQDLITAARAADAARTGALDPDPSIPIGRLASVEIALHDNGALPPVDPTVDPHSADVLHAAAVMRREHYGRGGDTPAIAGYTRANQDAATYNDIALNGTATPTPEPVTPADAGPVDSAVVTAGDLVNGDRISWSDGNVWTIVEDPWTDPVQGTTNLTLRDGTGHTEAWSLLPNREITRITGTPVEPVVPDPIDGIDPNLTLDLPPLDPSAPVPASRVNLRSYQRAILGQQRWDSLHHDPAVRRAAAKAMWYEPLTATDVEALRTAVARHSLNGSITPRRAAALSRIVDQLDVQSDSLRAVAAAGDRGGTPAHKVAVGQRIILPGGHGRTSMDVQVLGVKWTHGGRAVEITYVRTPDQVSGVTGGRTVPLVAPVPQTRILMRGTPVTDVTDLTPPVKDKPVTLGEAVQVRDLAPGDKILWGPHDANGPTERLPHTIVSITSNPMDKTNGMNDAQVVITTNDVTGEHVQFTASAKANLIRVSRADAAAADLPDIPDPTVTRQVPVGEIQVGDYVTIPPQEGTIGSQAITMTGIVSRATHNEWNSSLVVTTADGTTMRGMRRAGSTAFVHPAPPEPEPVHDPADLIHQPGESTIPFHEVAAGDRIQVEQITGTPIVGTVLSAVPEQGVDVNNGPVQGVSLSVQEDGTGHITTVNLYEGDTATLLSRGGADHATSILDAMRLDEATKGVTHALGGGRDDATSMVFGAAMSGGLTGTVADVRRLLDPSLGSRDSLRRNLDRAERNLTDALVSAVGGNRLDDAQRSDFAKRLAPVAHDIITREVDRIRQAAETWVPTDDAVADSRAFRDLVTQTRPGMTSTTVEPLVAALAQGRLDLTSVLAGGAKAPTDAQAARATTQLTQALGHYRSDVLDIVRDVGAHYGTDDLTKMIASGTIRQHIPGAGHLPEDRLNDMMSTLAMSADPAAVASMRADLAVTVNVGTNRALSTIARRLSNGATLDDAITAAAADAERTDANMARLRVVDARGLIGASLSQREIPAPTLPENVPADPAGRIAYWRAALPESLATFGQRATRTYTLDINPETVNAGVAPTVVDTVSHANDIDPGDRLVGETHLRHLHAIDQIGAAVDEVVQAEVAKAIGDQFPGQSLDAVLAGHANEAKAIRAEIADLQAAHTANRSAYTDQFRQQTGVLYADALVQIRTLEGQAASLSLDGHGPDPVRGAALALQAEALRNSWKATKAQIMASEETLNDARRRLHEVEQQRIVVERDFRAAAAEATRRALAGLIDLGPARTDTALVYDKTERHLGVKLLRRSEGYYPTSWLAALRAKGTISLGTSTRGSAGWDGTIKLEYGKSVSDKRAFSVAIHELGHFMERSVPGLMAAERAFYDKRTSEGAVGRRVRTGKNAEVKLGKLKPNSGYRASETTRQDDFPEPYSGKRYGEGGGSGARESYELFTTGIESLFAGSAYIDGDAEFRRFMLGVLVGLTPTTEA